MKQGNDFISDEELNAFLDDQLDLKERDRVIDAINNDTTVNRRINELRQVRDMVQHAYTHPPRRARSDKSMGSVGNSRWAIAASVMLCLGVVLGWLGHEGFSAPGNGQVAVVDQPQELKNVILHLTSDKPEKILATLDRAEAMLASYKANNKDLQLEIIANEGGLQLMRQSSFDYQQRIKQLSQDYDNVSFLACARAIKRLQEEGSDIELLPEVEVAPSALEQIILRMQEDWYYIKA